MSTLAKSEPSEIAAAPPQFIDPLSIDRQTARIEVAVERLITSSVGYIDDEVTRAIRRRVVTTSVRHVHQLREEMEGVVGLAELTGPMLASIQLDGLAVEMQREFTKLNPTADAAMIESAVAGVVAEYRERLTPVDKKKGKTAAKK